MQFSTVFTFIALASTTGWARYVLEDDYMKGGTFFDQFSFWNTTDPTNGFVSYQARDGAQALGLISCTEQNAQMRVDSEEMAPNGRPSVRITSNKSYQSGLIILDLAHMPGGQCGTWPAFWTVGPDWPNQGEIDIIEGVNDQTANSMALHTGPGCTIGSSKSAFSGSIATTNCDVNAAGQDTNVGCKITTSNSQTYGAGFNSNGGGVYATEWTGSAIAIYFFPKGSVPSDISSGSPNPSSWGAPMAKFQGGCDFDSAFTNQQIVFDTTFCGDWAGSTWSTSSCASESNTCEDFVANNPTAFQDAYWSINSLEVYQNDGGSSGPAPSSAPAPGPSQSTFYTVSSAPPGGSYSAPAPTSAPAPPSSAPSWPAPSAPAPEPSGGVPAPSGTPGWPEPSGSPHGPPHHSWGGSPPWQSGGGWGEWDNGHGAYVVGQPVEARDRHVRHLRKHKMHRAGKL